MTSVRNEVAWPDFEFYETLTLFLSGLLKVAVKVPPELRPF